MCYHIHNIHIYAHTHTHIYTYLATYISDSLSGPLEVPLKRCRVKKLYPSFLWAEGKGEIDSQHSRSSPQISVSQKYSPLFLTLD